MSFAQSHCGGVFASKLDERRATREIPERLEHPLLLWIRLGSKVSAPLDAATSFSLSCRIRRAPVIEPVPRELCNSMHAEYDRRAMR
jgi:hypothetical protein